MKSPEPLGPAKQLAPSGLLFLSGMEQKGHFLMPKSYRIRAIMAGMILDLRSAQFESSLTEIHVSAIMGGVEIIVGPGIRVELQGVPILGGFSQKVKDQGLGKNSPLLRIHGVAILGGVEIKTSI